MSVEHGTVIGVPESSVMPQACTPCLAKLDARSWDRVLAVATGEWHVGVRSNSPHATAVLEDFLGPVRAPQFDDQAVANFSVELADPGKRGPVIHLVYRDHEIVARERAVPDLLARLAVLLDEAPRLGDLEHLVLHATGVVDESGVATILPGAVHADLLTRAKTLDAAGLSLFPNRTQRVDVEGGTLIRRLVDPRLRALAESAGVEQSPVAIDQWCLPALGNEPFPLRPVQAVFAGYATVVNRDLVGQGLTLERLAAVVHRAQFWGLPQQRSNLMAAQVIDLVATESDLSA